MAARMGLRRSHVLGNAVAAAAGGGTRRLLLPPPPPLFLRLHQHHVHFSTQPQAATAAKGEAETSAAAPRYPPVLPSLTAMSKAAAARRRQEARARVRDAPSAAEKIRMLSSVQRLKYVVSPLTFSLNADRPYQHFTKTAFAQRLPERLAAPASSPPPLDRAGALTRDALLQEFAFVRRQRGPLYRERRHVVEAFVVNLVSRLTALLAGSNSALREACIDVKPDVGFYWWRGERKVPRGHRSGKIEPIRFQIEDKPINQIRMQQQLPEFIPIDSDLSIDGEVPSYTNDPCHLPLFRRQYENKIFTGAKINDPYRYGHTQFHVTADKLNPKKLAEKGIADQVEVRLRAHAIASLFAWTGAQAMYQGFWADEDLTRPFVSQAVITDGIHFSFFCYQLNTLALDTHTDGGNARRNVCWGTPSMRLYDAVEGSQVHGFNDEVVTMLVRLLLNQPLNPVLMGGVAEAATSTAAAMPGGAGEGPTTSG
uniref:39S ribosomal protein S30, mitochondrial n=1 Tax=Petromyzon marinus TaxID=7757 RepID=A0AAJ7WRV3_PETMA|nr:39S ribosomal protein S30, mitochondrial [Petromyzon marinus]